MGAAGDVVERVGDGIEIAVGVVAQAGECAAAVGLGERVAVDGVGHGLADAA